MAFTLLTTLLFYLVSSSVADNTYKSVTDTCDIAKEFEDFEIYVSRMEAMTENEI
jgi:hypothetical protein